MSQTGNPERYISPRERDIALSCKQYIPLVQAIAPELRESYAGYIEETIPLIIDSSAYNLSRAGDFRTAFNNLEIGRREAESARERSTDNAVETSICLYLTAPIAAYAPDKWEEACTKLLGGGSTKERQELICVARRLGDEPVTDVTQPGARPSLLGFLGIKRKNSSNQSQAASQTDTQAIAKERISTYARTSDQPEAFAEYVVGTGDLGAILSVSTTLNALSLFEAAAPRRESKALQGMGSSLLKIIEQKSPGEAINTDYETFVRNANLLAHSVEYMASGLDRISNRRHRDIVSQALDDAIQTSCYVNTAFLIALDALHSMHPDILPEFKPMNDLDAPADAIDLQPQDVTEVPPTVDSAAKEDTDKKQLEMNQLYDELIELSQDATMRIGELNDTWKLSKQELKKRKLSDALEAAVKGLRNAAGELVMPGRTKAEAQDLIGRIEALHILSSHVDGREEFNQAIADMTQAEQSAARDVTDILRRAEALPRSKREIFPTLLPNICQAKPIVDEIKENWHQYSPYIRKYWPNGDEIARSLTGMLFEDETDSSIAEQSGDDELHELPLVESLDHGRTLLGVAEQLDRIILPINATISDVERVIREAELSEEEAAIVDWGRLHNLVTVRDIYDGALYRSKKGSLGGAPPYFVVEIRFDGEAYAVAESPVEGNATYVVAEKLAPGNWLEVLSLPKADARSLGAARIIHRKGEKNRDHVQKIEDTLLDLMTVRA